MTLPRFSKTALKVTGFKASDIAEDGTVTLAAGCYEISYMPSVDYRCVYGPQTRLSELAGDEEVMGLLQKESPSLFGIIKSGDKENGNKTLAEVPYLFYLGVNPEMMAPVNEKIFSIMRY